MRNLPQPRPRSFKGTVLVTVQVTVLVTAHDTVLIAARTVEHLAEAVAAVEVHREAPVGDRPALSEAGGPVTVRNDGHVEVVKLWV